MVLTKQEQQHEYYIKRKNARLGITDDTVIEIKKKLTTQEQQHEYYLKRKNAKLNDILKKKNKDFNKPPTTTTRILFKTQKCNFRNYNKYNKTQKKYKNQKKTMRT
jgi:hypothetical protein